MDEDLARDCAATAQTAAALRPLLAAGVDATALQTRLQRAERALLEVRASAIRAVDRVTNAAPEFIADRGKVALLFSVYAGELSAVLSDIGGGAQ